MKPEREESQVLPGLVGQDKMFDFILITIESQGRTLSREWHSKSILLGTATTCMCLAKYQ